MSIVSSACSAPNTSASRSGPGSPARVRTVRSWSASEGTSSRAAPREKAPRKASMRRASLPSLTLGTARSCEATSDQQLSAASDFGVADLDGRLEDHAVEVDWHLDVAADRGRGAEGDVG